MRPGAMGSGAVHEFVQIGRNSYPVGTNLECVLSEHGACDDKHVPFRTPNILIRPCEVLSRVANVTILEVANNALRVLLQHRHVIIGSLA
jgi:hypothetical protein